MNEIARNQIIDLEATIKDMDGSLGVDPFPLEHYFAKGLYARQLTIPKGFVVVGKIHKFSHFVFYCRGDVTVVSEQGRERIDKPCIRISPEGAKRAFYAHEETVMMTIHAVESEDLDEIEQAIIAEDFAEIENMNDLTKHLGDL